MRITTFILAAALFAACGPSPRNTGDDAGGPDADNGGCFSGTRRCTGNTLETCTDGVYTTTQECPTACDSSLGCVVCQPGTGTCNGDTSHACLPDGSGYFDEYCDPVMGSTCDTTSGICVGDCSANTLGQSYIGCDYYATQSSQLVLTTFHFAIAVSNTTSSPATVTIDGGVLTSPIMLTVNPGAVATQDLPWVPALKTCTSDAHAPYECGGVEQWGALATNGSYHVRSTEPVTVYQFSPLNYATGDGFTFSYSNDASLLLPTNVWGKNYVVSAYQSWDTSVLGSDEGVLPSTMVVTAFEDGTNVTVTTKANTMGGNGAPSFVAGAAQSVTLNSGDALQLLAPTGDTDLTGSIVSSDKPIEVLAGHHCTQLPVGNFACDHIEENLFPVETLANQYIVAAPTLTGTGAREEVTRVVATVAGTTVTLDPASVGGPYPLANAGDFVELPTVATDFAVNSDHKVLVAQYMVGENYGGDHGMGDPSESLAVPVAQYRTSYQFHAPTNYTSNYVNVIAPTGASVMVDGTAVDPSAFTLIGGSGYGVARVALSNAGNGTHTASSTMAFGITVYGYGSYTSYWYPGGLDLHTIPVP
jgi:hypothetical protein